MSTERNIAFDPNQVAEFCRRNLVRRLSFFGSVIREDFRPDSDVDVLIEFEQDCEPGLFALSRMERELSGIIGHKVDLRTPEDLSCYFRDHVVRHARVQYAA